MLNDKIKSSFSFVWNLRYLGYTFTGLLLFMPFCVFTQDYPVSIRPIEGLPQYSRASDIVQDARGLLWFSYEVASNGLYIYDGQYLSHIGIQAIDSEGLTDVSINDIHVDEDQIIWLGTNSKGLARYDPSLDHFTMLKPKVLDNDRPQVFHITPSADGVFLWLATPTGLVQFNKKSNLFYHYPFDPKKIVQRHELFQNTFHHIIYDPTNEDRLWIGSLLGLVSFDISTKLFTHYPMPFSAKNEVNYPNHQYLINSLVFTDGENLWAGSWAGGILNYNTRTKKWKRYRDSSILLEDDVYYNLAPKDNESFWVLSNRGTGIFNTTSHAFQYLEDVPVKDFVRRTNKYSGGLFSFNHNALVTSGLSGAAIRVSEQEDLPDESLYPPLVREVKIDGLRMPCNNIRYDQPSIHLTESQHQVDMSIASPSFLKPDSTYYRYMLQGEDADWQLSRGKLELSYVIENAGRYTLRYQASHDGLTWVDGRSWRIEKFVPFWKYNEVNYILIAALLSLIGLYAFLQFNHRRKENMLAASYQHQLAESEMSALRAQMNPHFIFNSLNSIKSFILKQETQAANQYLTMFSQLMRLVLTNSKSKLIPIEQEVKSLQLYIQLEQLRFDHMFTSEVIVDDEIDQEHLIMPPMLVQPYVENAIWHGLMHKKKRGELVIRFEQKGDALEITVSDDGIGRKNSAALKVKKQKLHKSLGMRITKDRIELLKKSIGIDASVVIVDRLDKSGRVQGTRVTLTLPIIKSSDYEYKNNNP